MSSRPSRAQDPRFDETEVRGLYRQILSSWNRRNADAIAELFDEDGVAIGFDGSELDGREQIAAIHRQIFDDHLTGAFVGKVKSVRFLNSQVGVLSAVAGMVQPGQSDLDPERNAIQTVVAVKRDNQWRVAVFQNTPAQYHGSPDKAGCLTEELRKQL
jgi:uncharacterized protein (TIGR02246 family)